MQYLGQGGGMAQPYALGQGMTQSVSSPGGFMEGMAMAMEGPGVASQAPDMQALFADGLTAHAGGPGRHGMLAGAGSAPIPRTSNSALPRFNAPGPMSVHLHPLPPPQQQQPQQPKFSITAALTRFNEMHQHQEQAGRGQAGSTGTSTGAYSGAGQGGQNATGIALQLTGSRPTSGGFTSSNTIHNGNASGSPAPSRLGSTALTTTTSVNGTMTGGGDLTLGMGISTAQHMTSSSSFHHTSAHVSSAQGGYSSPSMQVSNLLVSPTGTNMLRPSVDTFYRELYGDGELAGLGLATGSQGIGTPSSHHLSHNLTGPGMAGDQDDAAARYRAAAAAGMLNEMGEAVSGDFGVMGMLGGGGLGLGGLGGSQHGSGGGAGGGSVARRKSFRTQPSAEALRIQALTSSSMKRHNVSQDSLAAGVGGGSGTGATMYALTGPDAGMQVQGASSSSLPAVSAATVRRRHSQRSVLGPGSSIAAGAQYQQGSPSVLSSGESMQPAGWGDGGGSNLPAMWASTHPALSTSSMGGGVVNGGGMGQLGGGQGPSPSPLEQLQVLQEMAGVNEELLHNMVGVGVAQGPGGHGHYVNQAGGPQMQQVGQGQHGQGTMQQSQGSSIDTLLSNPGLPGSMAVGAHSGVTGTAGMGLMGAGMGGDMSGNSAVAAAPQGLPYSSSMSSAHHSSVRSPVPGMPLPGPSHHALRQSCDVMAGSDTCRVSMPTNAAALSATIAALLASGLDGASLSQLQSALAAAAAAAANERRVTGGSSTHNGNTTAGQGQPPDSGPHATPLVLLDEAGIPIGALSLASGHTAGVSGGAAGGAAYVDHLLLQPVDCVDGVYMPRSKYSACELCLLLGGGIVVLFNVIIIIYVLLTMRYVLTVLEKE